MKDTIKLTIQDLVSSLLYYDRKEDEILGRGDIERAISDGTITVDEMVEEFKSYLLEGLS